MGWKRAWEAFRRTSDAWGHLGTLRDLLGALGLWKFVVPALAAGSTLVTSVLYDRPPELVLIFVMVAACLSLFVATFAVQFLRAWRATPRYTPATIPAEEQEGRYHTSNSPLRIEHEDGRTFHFRHKITRREEEENYDCYFIGIRNASRNHVLRNVAVRVIKIGNASHFSQLDLSAMDWFDPDTRDGHTVVDLAPGEMRRFQFAFQSVDVTDSYGVRFGRTPGFGLWPDKQTEIILTAFSSDEASDTAEFVLKAGAPGQLATIEPKPGRSYAP